MGGNSGFGEQRPECPQRRNFCGAGLAVAEASVAAGTATGYRLNRPPSIARKVDLNTAQREPKRVTGFD